VNGFGFVTIIKPAKCLEVDFVSLFMGIATFSVNIEIKTFFFFKIKTALIDSTGLKNEGEL